MVITLPTPANRSKEARVYAEHIKQVEKRVKSASPKLELDDKDAKGLIGNLKKE